MRVGCGTQEVAAKQMGERKSVFNLWLSQPLYRLRYHGFQYPKI